MSEKVGIPDPDLHNALLMQTSNGGLLEQKQSIYSKKEYNELPPITERKVKWTVQTCITSKQS